MLVAMLALPSVLPGQDAAAWRDSTHRLSAEVRIVRDSLRKVDDVLQEVVRQSSMTASATSVLQAMAAQVLAGFDSTRKRRFGEALPGTLGFRIVLRYGDSWTRSKPQALAIAGLPDTGDAPRVSPLLSKSAFSSVEGITREYIYQFGNMMMKSAPAAIQRWLPTGLPLQLTDADRREEAMYALVTGGGIAQRECVRGDLGSCGYVLGLRAPTIPEPGGQYYSLARADLLLTALDLGGEGAWDRLRDSPGTTVEEHLTAAAGMSADSLLSSWRSGLLTLRPDHGPIGVETIALLLAWTGLVLVVVLGIGRWL